MHRYIYFCCQEYIPLPFRLYNDDYRLESSLSIEEKGNLRMGLFSWTLQAKINAESKSGNVFELKA